MNSPTKPNLIKPRWSKVLSDLWGDKTRTILVVASIAVGVFAVGMIITAFTILGTDINASYASVNPANIEIWTDPFYENLVQIIEKLPGVEDVEGRRIMNVRARRAGENWQGVALIGLVDYQDISINQLDTIDGTQYPARDEVILSENLMNSTGYEVGDEIEIELPDGSGYPLSVVGLVTDQTSSRPDPNSRSNAFVTLDTMRAMGLGSYFNRLFITVEGSGGDEDFIETVSNQVESRIERNNGVIYRSNETLSTEHPMTDTVLAMLGVLGALGLLITVLSASLIINTLSALMTQQLRQIGVMKLVGGRSLQILSMYLALIMAYSVIALLLAVPLGSLAGYALANFTGALLGAVLGGFRVVPAAVGVQVIIAFIIPLAAGFFPVNSGARTNVRRAISNYRPGGQSARQGLVSRGARWFRWISRPILLSFRNTFRKKGRLLLTLFTLTIGGAVFIAVFNVRTSMDNVMDELMQHFRGDVTVSFSQPYRISKVERDLLVVPGVTGVEGWGGAAGDIVDENGDLVTEVAIIAPPQETQLLAPEFVAGRWLLPGEKKALVVSDTIYDYYPDLEPGDKLMIEINGGREEAWEVVGIFRYVAMVGDALGYANLDYISSIANLSNQAASFRLITAQTGPEFLAPLVASIEQQLSEKGYNVQAIEAGYIRRESAATAVNTLVLFLLIMAVLTAFVGSIGLTGTMSINVLERTREIGVMRTIGAVDFVVMQSVIIEGLVIGLITWVLAIGLSFPISSTLLEIIGQAMAGASFTLTYTPVGLLIWLGIVIVLSIVASIMPARNAASLTINEVLAYE